MKRSWILLSGVLVVGSLSAFANPDTRAPFVYNEAALLPIRSLSLQPGQVQAKTVDLPGITALFLIGDDPLSLRWLQQRLPQLQNLGAVGLVVNVESAAALRDLRNLAPGVSLTPMVGDDFASRLGLSHYPVLITATAIEQ
ncbi:integrating conjugative element protein, PFL_4695 family [Pseudomonas cedrina]|uniref:Integrating conjugative element protein n=2 Tax=Pseudomonas cedrina TaxID=651740 RepID=A0A1V2K0L4_PSECE|nr:integrating conjugative element protein [Pseudomonas cedrina]ONH50905.1 hypothetical protein BLL36_23635 [Pseudomonas cedrina subsp. cedrina]SDS62982.1 integrating conjugative element protein, PFL_4695 family [Pseudomonas cedrina]